MRSSKNKLSMLMLTLVAVLLGHIFMAPLEAMCSCSSPVNAIEVENCLAGNPVGDWDISGAGDLSIQGFTTDISVNKAETVRFKIQTDALDYRLDIYRIGYYAGNGARKVATVQPSASLPQIQPACVNDVTTKLTDCGNWAESASWTVPADATSGVYIAKLVRPDTGGASHIIFIVRDDSGRSDLLFKTSDTTWQAYNSYGLGYIEYPDYGYPSQKATKASYNRPFMTRSVNSGLGAYNWFFQSEYPMIRWLEANGYNVSYFTSVDADRRGAEILEHKVLLSVGHDEYWSGQMRTHVESARAAGVNLAFFSGNSIYRKVRWEASIDSSGTPYRTMVCYNESNAPAPIDPADPPIWTGTWRNPTFSPPADGGRPENALIGTLFTVSTGPNDLGISMEVPQTNGRLRFWRGTAAASLVPGQMAVLGDRVLGYEFDEDIDNGYRPAGLMQLSSTATPVTAKLLGNNIKIAADVYLPGSATHVMTLYRAASKALVFSAGTVHWSWGLDGQHDNGPSVPDPIMQQATVNIFADMGVQPVTLQPGLAAATASTDITAPVSMITSPVSGSTVVAGTSITITGTAGDSGGGVVGAVEVSTDGGATWHPVTGRESWSYDWSPVASGAAVIRSRAVDDSGNLESPAAGVSLNITAANSSLYTIWPATTVPALVDGGPDSSVELGVKFRSDVNGYINGIRFYKAGTNTGTHTGSLWSLAGTRLATVTFTNETSSGWQQMVFATPVAITANTVYVASYHVNNGHYSADINYFTGKGMDSPPLHALASGVSGLNGVYAYGTTSSFPTQSWNNANYWVDVVLSATPPATLSTLSLTPANPTVTSGATQQFTATATYSDGSTQNVTGQAVWTSSNTGVATITSAGLATAASAGSSTITATLSGISGSTNLTVPVAPLTITTAALPAATLNAAYSGALAASGGILPYTWTIDSGTLPAGLALNSTTGSISGTPAATGVFSFTVRAADSGAPQQTATKALSIAVTAQANYTIWPATTVSALVDGGPDSSVELGVKFRSDVNGYINGIRFYKAGTNTGTHTGSLWSLTGTRLATVTFTNETASGWQQMNFATPVAITANTVYVASYHVNNGHYSADLNYFTGKGMDSPPLHALASGVSGFNGVFAYGSTSAFPTQSWNNANYWVDVVLGTTPPATLTSIAVTPEAAAIRSGVTQQYTATATYSDSSIKNVTSQAVWTSSNTGVATINSAGLATGVSVGTTTVTATLSGVSGSTSLSVLAAPLLITSVTLPSATLNVTYSAQLTAGSGTLPYAWMISGGALPAGLSLNSTTGVISGTPAAAGSFSFTVKVSDSGNPQQTDSATLSIAVAAQADYTIWPATTVPALVDGGPDSSVELGVKFRSDMNGFVTGIRFYKAGTNTGSHTGSLWSLTGTRLATATFANETASGWQQINFAAPVAIAANTVYVASYHVNNGHYSADLNYFTGKGMDSPPLHALASGVSGANGVFAYGTTSVFPTQTWNNANYWVNVVFNATVPADTIPPTVTAFSVPTVSATLSVAVTSFSATDNVVVTGYLINESPAVPSLTDSGWSATIPLVFTFTTDGSKTLYAWARDAAGNVSASLSASVTVLPPDTTPPTVTAFSVPAISETPSVAVTIFSATDNVSVTGYLINESPVIPSLTDSGWSATTPLAYTFTTDGSKTLYAWARDAAGNVSASLSAPVIVLPPDTIPPTVTGFTIPASSAAFTVAITGFSATDNVAVTGYLINESAATPSPAAIGWSALPASSYTFTTTGPKTLHAWARDAAGNVSAGSSAAITLTSSGPVLLVSSASNPFSSYYAEIMRAEGFNAFAETDISSLTPELLAVHDVVILGDISLDSLQVTLISNWVNAGGKLIAMRPDKKLAGLLGLSDLGSTLSNAYLLVNTASGPGAGIVNQTMQYHGAADLYALNGATSLATLYSDATTSTSRPAVTRNSVGSNGGQTAAFTYDLARSVVYTRQGNPAWAGQDRDGSAPIRSNDLYFGNASFDRQPDWVDLNKVAIPQADEQQRLLANLIIQMNMDKKPLPRFWYFPRNLTAVVVMTGDDHGNNGTAGRFDSFLAASPPNCSVDNWECIRGTSYMYASTPLSNALASAYNTNGFEIAAHISTNCADWTPATLESFYATQLSAWRTKYASLPAQTTHRTHCIVWSDYATQPVVELAHGIRLDTTYYYYPSSWVADRPGFFTGSGIPMRFADANGTLIDVFQAATQMTDESGQTYPLTIDTLLNNAIGSKGYYGVFVANMHTDETASSGSDAIVASARVRGIPVVSSRQLLKWLDGRGTSTFGPLEWNGTVLGFSITAAQDANGLVAMVPVTDGKTVTNITRNGTPVAFAKVKIKGILYANFTALNGTYQVTYAIDATPPEISAVSPAQGATDVSTVFQTSVTFNELMDSASVTSSTFELRDPTNTPVPAVVIYNVTTQKALLEPAAPLANSTNYTATIKGGAGGVKDLAGNPLAQDFSWSFSTTATSNASYSVWPVSAVPGVIDTGPDSAVELGMRFRSDTSGYITGIRFYKASTNTGTHIANLWTNSGTLLATVPFSGESASGWQQVKFPVSVPISANTVYVASYHTDTAHYSYNANYFSTQGVDSPPLHALANGVSGFNGVYAYGSASRFPGQGWNSSNYWVDVVFSAIPTPTLSFITVTPGNQRMGIGTSQQFTATGTYSDGSTQNLTALVTWSSADTSVATINSAGLVTALNLGSTSITATLNGITGTTNLTTTNQIGQVIRGINKQWLLVREVIYEKQNS